MRLTFILFILWSKTYSQNYLMPIPDSITYGMINKFCLDDYPSMKRIYKIPTRYHYKIKSETDTNIVISGIDIFLERVKNDDTSKYFISDSDYLFLRKQIAFPEIKYFDHKKIHKTRVKRRASFIPITNFISVPIFTIDLQTAIITGNYWGMSRHYLYHKNPISKEWELVTQLWQNGS